MVQVIDTTLQIDEEQLKFEGSERKVIEQFTDEDAARILGHMDATSERNEALVDRAIVLDKQVSRELRQGKKTVKDLSDFQDKYDKAFKDLTKSLVQYEVKRMGPMALRVMG